MEWTLSEAAICFRTHPKSCIKHIFLLPTNSEKKIIIIYHIMCDISLPYLALWEKILVRSWIRLPPATNLGLDDETIHACIFGGHRRKTSSMQLRLSAKKEVNEGLIWRHSFLIRDNQNYKIKAFAAFKFLRSFRYLKFSKNTGNKF